MKILLLNLYFPPDTSATAKMAQTVVDALCKEHDVTIVCGRPSYDPMERRGWRVWRTETSGRVKIVRVGSSAFPRFNMKKRVINYLSYVFFAVPSAVFVGCDAVVAMTDPPFEGIVGAFVAMLKGKPYIYNIRDMYPDMAVGGSIVEPGLLARIWEKMHRWALRRAACVIVLGEDMKNRILAKGIDAAKIEIVRDGTEIVADGAAPTLDIDVVQKIRGEFRFVLLHAGNLGFYGAWNTLLAAAKELTADGVGFVFVGEGAQRDALAAEAQQISNVRFLPFFPGSKIPSVLAAADAHLITVKRGLEGVVVPSKMYGILAAGKPIVAVAPSETDVASLGEKQGFGIATNPDVPAELVAAIRALVADSNRLRQMGIAAKEAARGYDRVDELQKFVRIAGRIAAAAKN
ncbi:MAG TPA: glycosyltransferase family 4 protein [Candidatus Dormibacteraeota bacterium]|jgi:colanic acid biosynthesis glycosyl transferase WcaI|nr:glycosyltransferase family 4 protein [Candidatus Dormibacteraeota bacterium]